MSYHLEQLVGSYHLDQLPGQLHDGHLVAAAHVVHAPHGSLLQHQQEGLDDIIHVQEVPGLGGGALNGAG